MPREGHGSRNDHVPHKDFMYIVMPREGHGSRNVPAYLRLGSGRVMPREGHVSRNDELVPMNRAMTVMPREGHGSRNVFLECLECLRHTGHAPRGAWE